MGAYINPEHGTKEDWLTANAVAISNSAPTSIHEFSPEHLPVCLIDNGTFTAAGIAFDERELQAFSHPDGRRKQWLWVKKDLLMDPKVSDLHYYLKETDNER